MLSSRPTWATYIYSLSQKLETKSKPTPSELRSLNVQLFKSHLNAKSIKKKSEHISQPQIHIKIQDTFYQLSNHIDNAFSHILGGLRLSQLTFE